MLSANAAVNNIGIYFNSSDGFIKISKEGVPTTFAEVLPVKEQIILYATQTPTSETLFCEKSSAIPWKSQPTFYVVAQENGAINRALKKGFMSKRIKVKAI